MARAQILTGLDFWRGCLAMTLAAQVYCVVLGDVDVPQPSEPIALARNQTRSISFAPPAAGGGQVVVLSLLARLDNPTVAGYNYALRVAVNGVPLSVDQLLNKPLRVRSRGGEVHSMASRHHFATFYSPDFTSPDSDPHYGLLDGRRACLFEFDVTTLLRAEKNVLEVANQANVVDNRLVIGDLRIEARERREAAPQMAGPPTGELPIVEPRLAAPPELAFEGLPEATVAVTLKGEGYHVRSRFSTPEPAWVRGSNRYFRHERAIERRAESIIVRDWFTNLTDKPLALMQRHEIALPGKLKRCWLAGLEQLSAEARASQPANPTVFGVTDRGGVGMMPLGDAFRVHVLNSVSSGTLALADEGLVLGPHADYTAEWAIIPTVGADYWEFINAARRLVDANFTIDGGFAFLRAGPPVAEWSDEQLAQFIRFKDVLYTCASIDYPRYNGTYTHGTAFQRVSHQPYIDAIAKRRRLAPQTKNLVYFHCFIDVTEDGPQRFADARVLTGDGSHANYGEPHDRLYVPTANNGFGGEVARNVDVILDRIGADGVYWDEHEYSRYTYHYGEPWDGCSGEIDPESFAVRRLRSSLTLISESYRVALARRILERGALVGNSPPLTRAMAALKFPCFVETGAITHCAQAHLYSPIALGDHLTEFSEEHAYQTMLAALDYGCVYHWYNDVTVVPSHHHLTRYMYPLTPLELHEGYVIGRERILTNRSGRYGWGDRSRHEVHVFDATGREVLDHQAASVEIDGKSYTEIRIGAGWSAAIVRDGERRE